MVVTNTTNISICQQGWRGQSYMDCVISGAPHSTLPNLVLLDVWAHVKSVYTQFAQPKENGYLLGSKYSRYLSNLSILAWSIVVQLYRIVWWIIRQSWQDEWSVACMDGLRTGRWESVCSAFLGKLWVAAATEEISWEDLLTLGFAEIIDNLFRPLFEVTKDPNSHPALHRFLQ